MAGQTDADVTAQELETVRTTLPMMFDRDASFYAQVMKKDVEIVSKRDMRIPLRIRPGGYFGHFNPSGGDLGRGGAPKFEKALVSTVNLRYAIEWTDEAEWATDDRRKALVSVLKDNVAQAMPQFRAHVDSLCVGDGTGVLGTVSAIALNTPAGFDEVTLNTDGFGAKLLQFGQKITYYKPDYSGPRHASGTNTEIVFRDVQGKKIRTATTTGLLVGDFVVVEGLSGANPVSLLGIKYHHNNSSSGNWLGLSRSSFPEVQSNRVNAGGGGLSLQFPRQAINMIGDRLGMEKRTLPLQAWMHPCQAHAYEKLGQVAIQIQKQAKEEALNLYFADTGMQMAGAPVRLHYSWDKTRIDFISMDRLGRAEMHAADFYRKGGKMYFEVRSITDGSVNTATLVYITVTMQLFHENPAEGAYIDNLAVPAGY